MWLLSQKEGNATANWLQTWGLMGRHHNTPHIARIPVKLDYPRKYAPDMAYMDNLIELKPLGHSRKAYTRH